MDFTLRSPQKSTGRGETLEVVADFRGMWVSRGRFSAFLLDTFTDEYSFFRPGSTFVFLL